MSVWLHLMLYAFAAIGAIEVLFSALKDIAFWLERRDGIPRWPYEQHPRRRGTA